MQAPKTDYQKKLINMVNEVPKEKQEQIYFMLQEFLDGVKYGKQSKR